MATPTTTASEPSATPTSRQIAAGGQNLADMLASAGNGIRITGLVLVADEPREFKGTGAKSGKPYAFKVRELQIFTGNKAVTCKQSFDLEATVPPVQTGTVQTYKIKSVRLNGTEPVFELDSDV